MSALYRIFLKGLLFLLPIMITIYLLVWVATRAEAVFGEPLQAWFPYPIYFPGLGVVLVLLVILAVGAMVDNYLTQRFFDMLERWFENLPVIKSIYGPLRDVTQLFAKPSSGAAGQKVVMVLLDDTPGSIEMLGLVTRETFADLPIGAVAEGSIAVFIPFSYGMGGFTVIVPRARVRETGIAAERAMQLAITGWIKASK